MKTILFLTGIGCMIILSAAAQEKAGRFVLHGKYAGPAHDTLYLSYTNDKGKYIVDSTVVTDGVFTFHGLLSEPAMAYLQASKNNRDDVANFFLEAGTMQLEVRDHLKSAVVTGSHTQDEWRLMEGAKASIRKEMEPLNSKYSVANNAYMAAKKDHAPEATLDTLKYRAAAIHDAFEPYHQRMEALDFSFFHAHPSSIVTAYYLRYYVSGMPADTLRRWYNALGSATQQTSYGKLLQEELSKKAGSSPGSMAKDFDTKDMDGKPLQLSAFKGKYVLLDFWASWCIPCRKGNPHLKRLYEQYHSKGLEIIGVSDDDRDTSAWHKAVAKDGLPWHHVLRGLRFEEGKGYDKTNDISEGFGIHTLPTKILIDRNGQIIGRYGSDGEGDEALDEKLRSMM